MNTLVVIAHHNGSQFIGACLESLPKRQPFMVVDTGSTQEEYDAIPTQSKVRTPGGYCWGAYKWAYHNMPFNNFFFMHDSMTVKRPDFIEACQSKSADLVAWLTFPMDFGTPEFPEYKYLASIFGDVSTNLPSRAIFGPIFYATRTALDQIASGAGFPPNPTNRMELCASERGIAIAAHRSGLTIDFLEEPYDNERIDVKRDYVYFNKFRPNRE